MPRGEPAAPHRSVAAPWVVIVMLAAVCVPTIVWFSIHGGLKAPEGRRWIGTVFRVAQPLTAWLLVYGGLLDGPRYGLLRWATAVVAVAGSIVPYVSSPPLQVALGALLVVSLVCCVRKDIQAAKVVFCALALLTAAVHLASAGYVAVPGVPARAHF